MAATDLNTAIQNWEAELASDSANPQPSYTLNGKSVSRTEWRTALLENIKAARRQYNQHVPFITRTLRRM